MRGQVIFQFVYDLGGEIDLDRVGRLIDEQPIFEPLEIRKEAPRYVDLPRPLTVRFPSQTRATTLGERTFEMQARVYGIGAVAFTLRTNAEVPDVPALVPYGRLKLVDADGTERALETLTRAFYDQMRDGLATALVEQYPAVVDPEPYVVYALDDLSGATVPGLLAKERRALAGLLAGEREYQRLSDEEAEDNLRYWYRYYEDDLVVMDWEYALVVEPTGKYEDVLYVIELANLQLLELRTYDRYLDSVLDKAYDDLNRFYGGKGLFASARGIQQELSDARIDLTRVTDAIDNIGKIYGDWYLAKLHIGLASRFHLAEWERIVNAKMQTLNDLYTLASHEVEHRRGVLLESLIVLLFVIDLVLIFMIGTG